jgi:two-component system phosphate regulon sensor histidine kinase PhoR
MRRIGGRRTRWFIGVRWWLGIAFAFVAASTTAVVVSIVSSRLEHALRGRAEQLAYARTLEVAPRATSPAQLAAAARRAGMGLYLFDRSGHAVTHAGSRVAFDALPGGDRALRTALDGRAYHRSDPDGRAVVVAVPLANGGALVARSPRPELSSALGVIGDQAFRSGVIAGLVGVLVGLVLAQLIALRLARLSAVAEAIAHGDFDTPAPPPRVRDEFGALASSLERMRANLRRSFRELESERDRLRLLLERLHEGVVTVDRRLTVQFANGEARRLLGSRLHEGEPLPDPWPGVSLRAVAEGLFQPDAQLVQERLAADDERAIALAGIPAAAGETALLVLEDLSEAERRELSEREFVANAAHELRTPLTTIVGAVEVLQSGAKENPVERDRFLDHIERESGRLARLAHALLVLARAQTRSERVRLEHVELAPLLFELAQGLSPRDGVQVEVECSPGLAVRANGDLLEQALRNLAENATKHTASGRIVLRGVDLRRGGVRVEVEDTGPGIPPETQRHVFERFYRGEARDSAGFGLGLAIVRQAVAALDGRIELDSAPGAGTRVGIVLRASRSRVAAPQREEMMAR